MQQLETTKGKSIIVPQIVKRYLLMTWHNSLGWNCSMTVYTTPESAIQDFLDKQNKYYNNEIEYYKCIEVELEIPFIPKNQ